MALPATIETTALVGVTRNTVRLRRLTAQVAVDKLLVAGAAPLTSSGPWPPERDLIRGGEQVVCFNASDEERLC
jgi:hypothetical protein